MGESVLMSDAPVNANQVEQYSRVVKAVELDEIRLLKVVAECTPGTQPQAIDVETSFRLDKVVDIASGRLEAQAHLLVSGNTVASREPIKDGSGNVLGCSGHDFDIALLGIQAFEGYECKARVGNFLGGRTQDKPKSKHLAKLAYMCRVKSDLIGLGFNAHVFLAGYDKNMSPAHGILVRYQFAETELLSSRDIRDMIVAARGRQIAQPAEGL